MHFRCLFINQKSHTLLCVIIFREATEPLVFGVSCFVSHIYSRISQRTCDLITVSTSLFCSFMQFGLSLQLYMLRDRSEGISASTLAILSICSYSYFEVLIANNLFSSGNTSVIKIYTEKLSIFVRLMLTSKRHSSQICF